MTLLPLRASEHLHEVKYEIRGALARLAEQLEREGHDVIKLNIGNPGAFGFRMPPSMRVAIVENLHQADPYSHQKGIFPAREAVVMQQQNRGVMDVTADDVFIGNGVSELIMLAMRALLNPGDEVLVPSPDYPLWTASVVIHGAKAVHYPCRPERGFVPDPAEVESLITDKTRALVVINPNNPSGAVYPREVLTALAEIAERRHLVLCADEIYDEMLYDGAEFVPLATLAKQALCLTFSGLSKVYRACGLRVGWLVFSGEREHARDYLHAIDLLASLRLCSNVPGQFAVQTALEGHQSIFDLTAGRPAAFHSGGAPRRDRPRPLALAGPADGGDVWIYPGSRRAAPRRACRIRRPGLRPRSPRTQARARGAGLELQRAIRLPLPGHIPARCRPNYRCLRADRIAPR